MPPNRTEEGRVRKKPGKPITSCAECRRLKLRCDKQVPCSTCVTRGCDAICPDGSLVSRKKKGVFVLTSTKDLHERIDTLISRISTLENALHTMQPSHPLLNPDLLTIKTTSDGEDSEKSSTHSKDRSPNPDAGAASASDEERLELEEAFGTLAIEEEGMTGFLGGTSRVEYLLRAGDSLPTDYQVMQPTSRLKPRVVQAALSMFKPSTGFELISDILSAVPPLSLASRICELYITNFQFLYQPMSRSELFDGVLRKIYEPTSNSPEDIHVYGLLFGVLALGSLFDVNQTAVGALGAHDYHLLSLACISLSPLYYPKASLDKVELLLFIAMYMHFADYGSVPRHDAWFTIGHALRLSVSIGLHLNNERWNLPGADLSRRSRVFWTIYELDTHIGFGLGRPPSLSHSYIDCPIPKGVIPQELQLDGDNTMSYHEWMARWTAVMHSVQLTAFSTSPASYTAILALDQQVRNFPTPEHLRMNNINVLRSEQVANAMPRILVLLLREGVLLPLHQRYLHAALREMPEDVLKHKYAPSVMAVYRSSWRLIEALLVFWSCQSRPFIERISGMWSYVLMGCLAMCTLIIKAPSSSLTTAALSMLDRTAELFQKAAPTCHFAFQHRDFIRELQADAHSAANAFRNGLYSGGDQLQIELFERLAGKTHLIYTPSSRGSAPNTPPNMNNFLLGSREEYGAGTPPDSYDPTSDIHAALLQDLSLFNSTQERIPGVDDLTPDYPEASLAYAPYLSNIPTAPVPEESSESWNTQWSSYPTMGWQL